MNRFFFIAYLLLLSLLDDYTNKNTEVCTIALVWLEVYRV